MNLHATMGVVTATVTPNAPVDAMLADLGHALSGLGASMRVLLHDPAFANPALMQALVMELRRSGQNGFILNLNAKDELVLGERDGRVLTIHDAWNIPLVAWMVDHPAHHWDQLQRIPENAVIAVIDESHLGFLKDAGLAARAHLFLPHGGPGPVPRMATMAKRDVDVLFVGTLDAPESDGEWLERTAQGDHKRRRALSLALDAVRGGMPLYETLRDALAASGLGHDLACLVPLIRAMDHFVNQSRRLDLLSHIRGHKVTIVGDVHPQAAARLSDHVLKGPASFAQVLALMGQSRLVLNSRMTFAAGAHERLFYAISRGALCLTEPSRFLDEDLAQGAGMLPFACDLAHLDDQMADLLRDSGKMQDGLALGQTRLVTHHGWDDRAGRVAGALAGLWG